MIEATDLTRTYRDTVALDHRHCPSRTVIGLLGADGAPPVAAANSGQGGACPAAPSVLAVRRQDDPSVRVLRPAAQRGRQNRRIPVPQGLLEAVLVLPVAGECGTGGIHAPHHRRSSLRAKRVRRHAFLVRRAHAWLWNRRGRPVAPTT
jgi:hypothetical protein